MLAISNPKRTKYADNNGKKRHVTMISGRITRNTHFECLQPYLVPIEKDCKHKKAQITQESVLDLRLLAYSVPFET